MQSSLHEAILTLLREQPGLAADLLTLAGSLKVPPWTTADISEATFSELPPTEYRADLVIVLRQERPVFGIVCEAQLRPDPDKPYRWPCYGVLLRDRLRCPVLVLVITPNRAVASWASRPIQLGGPGSVFVPVVIGPEQIPWVHAGDPVAPEKAVLSALAHGNEPGGLDTVMAAIQLTSTLDEGLAAFYYDLIASRLDLATRIALEELMQTQGYEYKSEFAREYFSKGKLEGKLEGTIETLRRVIVDILEARGFQLTAQELTLLKSEAVPARLHDWSRRAALVTSASELFVGDHG